MCHGADGKGYLADEASSLSNQDYMVCQELGIESGYTQQKDVFKD